MAESKKLEVGNFYDRKEISEILSGNYRCALPHTKGEVVAGCYDPTMNPNAPREILVGKGRDKEHYSQQLADQEATIPIFLKRVPMQYEFIGYFQAKKYSDNCEEVERKNNTDRNNNDIAGVLYFEEAKTV
jgi:hypothetical protein